MPSFFAPTSFIAALREGLAAAVVLAGIALAYPPKIGRAGRGKNGSRKNGLRRNGLCADDLRGNDLRKDDLCAKGLRHAGSPDGADADANGKRVELEMSRPPVALTDLEPGEAGTIDHISLPLVDQQFLMRVGFVPGVQVGFSRRAPLGDPSVYSVDGTEIALRAETARSIMVRRAGPSPLGELP